MTTAVVQHCVSLRNLALLCIIQLFGEKQSKEMAERPKLQRRMAIGDNLMDLLKSPEPSPVSSPMGSPSVLSPNSNKLAPNRAARGLKREVAVRQLPIRLIEQIGAPSSRRASFKRAGMFSSFIVLAMH